MFNDRQFYIIGGVLLVAAYVASQQVSAIGSKLDPTSDENIVYGFANRVTRMLTQRQVDSIGRPLTFGAFLAGE